jgi:hypothetical protein
MLFNLDSCFYIKQLSFTEGQFMILLLSSEQSQDPEEYFKIISASKDYKTKITF